MIRLFIVIFLTCSIQPLGASTSSVSILGPTDTQGQINITISDGHLNATDQEHESFSAFSEFKRSCSNSSFLILFISRHGTYGFANHRIFVSRQLDRCSEYESRSDHA